jgi:SAM-dependent methyltransferase
MAEPLKINRGPVELFEQTHYSRGEEKGEIEQILAWYKKTWEAAGRPAGGSRVLELGCGPGLHSIALARNGFTVTGLARTEAALEAAREHSADVPNVEFHLSDIENDNLVPYGIQNLVLSLGNTVSQLKRSQLVVVFDRIRRLLAPRGALVFNAVYWSQPFFKNIIERDASGEISVIWERELQEDKGAVLMKGHFVKENYDQAFEVQCFKVAEMLNLLEMAGLRQVKWSHRLDFKGKNLTSAASIYYRASR